MYVAHCYNDLPELKLKVLLAEKEEKDENQL